MREEAKKWSLDVLQMHSALMYDTLIHSHNITTEHLKQYEFEDQEGLELPQPLKGYFAVKEVDGKKVKYFVESQFLSELPIRVNDTETLLFKESSRSKSEVLRPTNCTAFRVNPEKIFNTAKELIDTIAPFNHTRPEMWTLNKIIAIMGYVGRTYIGICSASEFGKSSAYLVIDAITKKCPVFQPRSVPGILTQITSDGNIVFDEVQKVTSEVKNVMENFALQVAGNAPIYINGARKAVGTKQRYDVSLQSITFLYNIWSNYANPEEEFFDNIWSNKKAIDSRFLKVKLEGVLTERFDKNFDIVKVAEDNKMFYMKVAKHLLFLKHQKQSNSYTRRYSRTQELNLKGRHKLIYDEITWGIDCYSESQKEYDDYVNLLNGCINSYKEMLGDQPITYHQSENKPLNVFNEPAMVVEEETIEDEPTPKPSMLEYIKSNQPVEIDKVIELYGEDNIDEAKKKGDIYESKRGYLAVLE
jgi:hypothetical protein